jgi:hypothetical protein
MGKKKSAKKGSKGYNRVPDDGGEHVSRSPSMSCSRKKRRGKNNKASGNFAEDSKLRDSLESDGSKTIIDMDADGNCLFRSLSDQLYHDFGSKHAEIRSDVCDYLEAFEEDFSVFLVLDENEDDEDAADFNTYIKNMRQDGDWGGNVELVAAARLYRRNITVFSASMGAYTIEHGSDKQSAGSDLCISYHDNDHYNSVRNHASGKPSIPLKTFVKSESDDNEFCTERKEAMVDGPCDESTLDALPDTGMSIETTKKSAPCPCGSGLRYKKCCFASKSHVKRLHRMQDSEKRDANVESEHQPKMDGTFRVMTI